MRPFRKVIPGALLIMVLAGLSACGKNATPVGTSSPPAPSAPTAAATASPSPTAAAPAKTTRAPETVVSSRVTFPWHWPNDVTKPANIQHTYAVPPLPEVIAIRAGDHPGAPAERADNRMSFTFTSAFPSYQIQFVRALVTDPAGRVIPLAGDGVLKVTFRQAQAHTPGGQPSIVSQPPAHLGYSQMVSWAPAGDFEGVLTYGIGIAWPVSHSNPQLGVRATEVEKVTGHGQHRYIVAIDVDASSAGSQR